MALSPTGVGPSHGLPGASKMPKLPKAPRLRPRLRSFPEISLDEIRDALRDRQRRIARGWRNDPSLAAWQTFTALLWLGSGIPVPDRPVRSTTAQHAMLPADDALMTTEQGRWLASQMHSLTRRFWLAWMTAATLRGVALGTIACTIWTLGAIAGAFPQPRVLPFVLLVVLGGVVGLAFGLVNRPSLARVAAMLDRTFDLRERMVTAFSPPDATPRIRAIQLADAANAFVEIQHDVRGAAVLPMREMVIAALAGIALVTALLFNIASAGIAPTEPVTIPVFVPSSERFAREAQEQKAQELADAAKKEPAAAAPESQSGSNDTGAVGDLRAVGTALGTNETTSPAATQIAEGDYAGAKDSLNQSADAAANLPQEERDALADQLDQAAAGMADGPLKDATEKAADGMREGGDAAKQGMNDLADQIGKTGQQATTQGQAGSTGSNTQGASESSQQAQSSSSSSNGSGSGQQGQASDKAESGQSGSSSDSGASQGDPGEGMAASSGIGSDPGQEGAGQQGASGNSGSSSQSGSGQAGQEGQQGASSSGANGSGGSSQQSGSNGGQTGSDAQSGSGGSQKSGADGGSQANGAAGGSSQSDGAKSGGSDSSKNGSANSAQDGQASSNVKPGDPGTTSGNSDVPSASSGDQTVVLQGTSEESGVATGNETGASSSGSGSGAGASAGSGKQGTVGPAGPDSNRVPEKYRDLVKAYFDGDGLPTEDGDQ